MKIEDVIVGKRKLTVLPCGIDNKTASVLPEPVGALKTRFFP